MLTADTVLRLSDARMVDKVSAFKTRLQKTGTSCVLIVNTIHAMLVGFQTFSILASNALLVCQYW